MGCSTSPVSAPPHVPDELLQGCYLEKDADATTATVIGDMAEALICANGRIEAIAVILRPDTAPGPK